MTGTIDHRRRREQMVEMQIARRGMRDARVLAAMRAVPRERFVDPALADLAYEDRPLPIEAEQTISQPYIVAAMIAAAAIAPGDHVLEVGTGSGYAAAVIAAIAGRVDTIERHAALGRRAAERLAALGCDNVAVRIGDGSNGLAEAAPFDAILVAAAAPAVPPALKQQLRIGGRLVMPVGGDGEQTLCKLTRIAATRFEEQHLGAVAFVPLIGAPA